MMAGLGWGAIGAGAALAGRPFAVSGRTAGAALICLSALCLASPSLSDQNVMGDDKCTVKFVASAKDLPRVSLDGDQFVLV